MLLNSDEKIVDSALDSLPVTAESLKELGWKYVSSTSHNYGGHYVYWTIWRYVNLYIEMFQDGRCFLKKYRNDTCITAHVTHIGSVGELKKYM